MYWVKEVVILLGVFLDLDTRYSLINQNFITSCMEHSLQYNLNLAHKLLMMEWTLCFADSLSWRNLSRFSLSKFWSPWIFSEKPLLFRKQYCGGNWEFDKNYFNSHSQCCKACYETLTSWLWGIGRWTVTGTETPVSSPANVDTITVSECGTPWQSLSRVAPIKGASVVGAGPKSEWQDTESIWAWSWDRRARWRGCWRRIGGTTTPGWTVWRLGLKKASPAQCLKDRGCNSLPQKVKWTLVWLKEL